MRQELKGSVKFAILNELCDSLISKLDTDRHKRTVPVFWKNFRWIGLGLLLFILCDIIGEGIRPILRESRTAQVIVEDNWTQWTDSLYSFFEEVSNWIMLAIGTGVLVALLIVVLVSAVRRLFVK